MKGFTTVSIFHLISNHCFLNAISILFSDKVERIRLEPTTVNRKFSKRHIHQFNATKESNLKNLREPAVLLHSHLANEHVGKNIKLNSNKSKHFSISTTCHGRFKAKGPTAATLYFEMKPQLGINYSFAMWCAGRHNQ